MEIKFKSSENLDKRSLYKHMHNEGKSLKDVQDGTEIEPIEIVVYEDINNRGETQTITSVLGADGEYYSTNSRFFREDLSDIYNLMAPDAFTIVVRKEVSKAGRTFIKCLLK